jgi:glycerophosphoryl diester phosphodiesterase
MLSTTLFALALQAATCNCQTPEDTVIIGHRGSGGSSADNPYAENTLPSVANAFDEGADMVEIDVHLSRDGEVVLLHDFALDKTTNLEGCVADYDYAALATADATVGSGATEKVGIPRLRDVLDIVKKRDRKLNIELKVLEKDGTCLMTDIEALAAAVVDEVEAANMTEAVVFSSFDFDILSQTKALNASIPVALLTGEGGTVLQEQAAQAEEAGFEGINPLYVAVATDEEGLKALKETGLLVSPWTVNDAATISSLISSGVNGVITDDVPAALAARDEAEIECPCAAAVSRADESDSGGCQSNGANSAGGWLFPLLVIAGLAIRRFAVKAV